jgi:L-ascorbate metabolism protein UlaG (beta-lactamase superfamily)
MLIPMPEIIIKIPADIVLITHEHYDHNDIKKINFKKDTIIIRSREAIIDGIYKTFNLPGLKVTAVPAYNEHHLKKECVGYILELNNKKLYFAGDTSYIKELVNLASYHLDYAFLPGDGIFNMGPLEASKCAEVIGAKHNTLIHTSPEKLIDQTKIAQFPGPNKLVMLPNDEIII